MQPHPRHLRDAVIHVRGPAPSQVNLGLVLTAAAIAMFAINLDFFALNLSIPRMAEDLDVSTTDMQWAISGYMLALGAFLIPGGRLGDIFGRRRMLITGTAIFGISSLIGGLAPSAGFLIGARLIQGIGAAILFPLCIAVVSNTFPEARRNRAIGNLYGLGAMATAAGPFVGGALTELLTWRWVLLVNAPIAAAAIVLMLRSVPESRDETVPRHLDLTGLAAVALGIGLITFAVDRGQDWDWGSPRVVALFAAGALLLIAFVALERRVRWPLVDLSLFRSRPYVGVTLLGTTANVVFVVTTFASTLYLQDVEGHSPLIAGLIFLGASGMVAIAGPLSGRLAERFNIALLMGVAIGVGAVGLLVVSLGGALPVYVPALAVFGLGYGLCWSLVSVGTQAVVPDEQAGEASGVSLAIVIGAAGLCVAIAAALIDSIAAGGTGEGVAIEDILRGLAIASVILAVPFAALGRAGGSESR